MTTNPEQTERVITQGRALVHAIEALETVEPSAASERAIAGLLVKAYRRRLRAIIGAPPAWVGNRILSASDNIPGHGSRRQTSANPAEPA